MHTETDASVALHTAFQSCGSTCFFDLAQQLWDNGHVFVQNWGDDMYPLANLTETSVVAKMAEFARNAGVGEAQFYRVSTFS